MKAKQSEPKYKLGQILYVGEPSRLVEEDGKYFIKPGEIKEMEVMRISEEQRGDELVRTYNIGYNLYLEESRVGSMCFLTKEEARKAWKEPSKDNIIRACQEKIEWHQITINHTQKHIDQLNKIIKELHA